MSATFRLLLCFALLGLWLPLHAPVFNAYAGGEDPNHQFDDYEYTDEDLERMERGLPPLSGSGKSVKRDKGGKQSARLPEPPMPEGVAPDRPAKSEGYSALDEEFGLGVVGEKRAGRMPDEPPMSKADEEQYRLSVLRELQMHKQYVDHGRRMPGGQDQLIYGEPYAGSIYLTPDTPLPPVQNLGVMSMDELEDYINQLDLSSYAGALAVEGEMENHRLVRGNKNLEEHVKNVVLSQPATHPEVPPAFQRHQIPVGPTVEDVKRQQHIARQAEQVVEGTATPRSIAYSPQYPPQYGPPYREPSVLDMERSELFPQTALPQESMDLLSQITAGSLTDERDAGVSNVSPEPVVVERGQVNNPFDTANKEQDVVEGVAQEPIMESSLNVTVSTVDTSGPQKYTKAYEALNAGQYEGAMAFFKQILATEPQNSDALFGLAYCYQQTGQFTQARNLYLDVLKVNNKHRGALNNFLMVLTKENPNEALRQLKILEKNNPEYERIPAQIAMTYSELGEYENAAKYMSRAAVKAPDKLAYRHYLALLMQQLGHYEIAEELYRQIFSLHRSKGYPLPANAATLREEVGKLAQLRAGYGNTNRM